MTSSTVAASLSPVKLLPPEEEGEGEVREPLQLLAVVGDLAVEVEVEEEEKELLEAGGLEVETLEVAEVVGEEAEGEEQLRLVEVEVPGLEEEEEPTLKEVVEVVVRVRVMWSAVGVGRR